MTAVASTIPPRAFVVWFRDLHRWSVGSFVEMGWRWPTETILPLSAALSRKSMDFAHSKTASKEIRLVTLHFDGQMELRGAGAGESFKGRLFIADPGDVIYSKIDVRNGAIGIIPDGLGQVCVSSEYPVYSVDPHIAEARYIRLLFRTDVFRRKINSMISGASGRKRVQPSDLESVEVPLPGLPVQRKIVAAWEAARKSAAATAAKIERLERDIEARFLADLGLKAPAQTTLPKVFAMRWKDLTRWSVGHIRMSATTIDLSAAKYPAVPMHECLVGTMNGYCIKPVAGPTPYKMLKLNALRPAGLDLSASKYIDVPDETAKRFHLRKGDLLICRSVGSFDHIAKCALVESDEPSVLFPDIIIRARFNGKMLPEYAREFIQTKPGRTYFQQNARTAVGMWKIGGADIANLPIPLPPLRMQHQIVERVAKRREEIARLKADAKTRADAAKADVEAMILGTKLVE
jgi:type I restriction enzyme S subunit